MAEQQLTRTRERELVPGSKYEAIYSQRAAFVDRQKNGTIVVKESDREWELSRQGHLKFYLLPWTYPDTVLHEWFVFIHDVKKQSGKHRHQGGLVLFVIEGEGATEVNGERVEGEEGDCILLPLHPDGIEHVHFNRGDGAAKWLAFIYEPVFHHVSSELTQTAVMTEFQQTFGGG